MSLWRKALGNRGGVWHCRLESHKEDMKIGYRLPENNYSQQAIDFMDKVLDISGLGNKTFLPDGEPENTSCC